MEKIRRSERIVLMLKKLMEIPNTLISLNYFTEQFGLAKSTVSEDLAIIKNTLENNHLGLIETTSGAAGGIKYIPIVNKEETHKFLAKLSETFSTGDRFIPGGFIYMNDIIFDPNIVSYIGEIFATKFVNLKPDYILTIETKGIPLAFMTARALNIPLLIVRNENRVTEGSTVSINHISGSTKRIQTMSLPRRALRSGSKVIIIDDFMKAGGTARGMMDLMQEFSAEVLGIGVLVGTPEPQQKLVSEYFALLMLEEVDEINRTIKVKPNL
jgi:purine operon repressor